MENGWWAMYGSRLGTYYTMLREWDYTQVQSFDALDSLWDTFRNDDILACISLGDTLTQRLGLPIITYNEQQSRFFKHHYRSNWHNRGAMVTEMDVIRSQEGW